MRKHWWQNSADPSKPQSCGLPRLHLTVWETQPSHWPDRDFFWSLEYVTDSFISFCLWKHVPALLIFKLIMDICYWTQMPVLFLSVYWVGCWVCVSERCGKPSKERLSVFLENVRQEMPKAHLELLHSGSLCVTAEASGALLCLPVK